MAEASYLVVLALLEQDGKRGMPLQGQSLHQPLPIDGDPGEIGRLQALELLVRVWQRSDAGSLRRAAGSKSLLLLTLPIETLAEQLPALKAKWIRHGDTQALLSELTKLAEAIWTLSLEKREPLQFQRLN
jgi:hypothetical protein